MNENMANLNRISSQLGRDWVDNLSLENSPQTLKPSDRPEIVVVSIPDLRIEDPSDEAPMESNSIDSIAATLHEQIESLPEEVFPHDATADLPETVSDWGRQEPSGPQRDSEAEESYDLQAIRDLTDQILDRFPMAKCTSLVFAGSEDNPNTEETCALVARELSRRREGSVLLVDANFESRTLTQASGLIDQPGLQSILWKNADWRDKVVPGGKDQITFLGAGPGPVYSSLKNKNRSGDLIKEWSDEYRFVLIAAGRAHFHTCRKLAKECNGTFLVVSLKHSSQTVARAAVQELQTAGAFVLGCIVTESTRDSSNSA